MKNPRGLGILFNRYYWLQIAIIALAVIFGVLTSAGIVKNLLITTAMEQEAEHYWKRYDAGDISLPNTKNLYGYRWTDQPPSQVEGLPLMGGVHSLHLDGKSRITIYQKKGDQQLLLVFGESNVDRLVWLFGIAPLILSLLLMYSILWALNRQAKLSLSPITQLANELEKIDFNAASASSGHSVDDPFAAIDTSRNYEATSLKQSLQHYHHRLLTSFQRERDFSSHVSHELRTPLSVIKGNSQILQQRDPDNQSLKRIFNAVQDMEQLTHTLLSLARSGLGAMPVEDCSICEILSQRIAMHEPLAQQRGTTIELHTSAEKVVVATNRAVASIVFDNLIRNSLNYSGSGKLAITCSEDQVSIIDNGVGVSMETITEIMQSTEPAGLAKGHGIGLKLVKRLCDDLGWRLDIKSEPEQGFIVVIELGKEATD